GDAAMKLCRDQIGLLSHDRELLFEAVKKIIDLSGRHRKVLIRTTGPMLCSSSYLKVTRSSRSIILVASPVEPRASAASAGVASPSVPRAAPRLKIETTTSAAQEGPGDLIEMSPSRTAVWAQKIKPDMGRAALVSEPELLQGNALSRAQEAESAELQTLSALVSWQL